MGEEFFYEVKGQKLRPQLGYPREEPQGSMLNLSNNVEIIVASFYSSSSRLRISKERKENHAPSQMQ